MGIGAFTGVLSKLLGAGLLHDLQTFVAALDTMFGGFRQRAEQTYALLQAPGTAFLVVAAPEPDALREAAYFVERLAEDGMPLAGLVLNRVHAQRRGSLSADRSMGAAEQLDESGEHAPDRRPAAGARRADAAGHPRGAPAAPVQQRVPRRPGGPSRGPALRRARPGRPAPRSPPSLTSP